MKALRHGFTLVELLIVIVIIAILASIMMPAIQQVRETANRATCQSNMRDVALAIQNYTTRGHGWPQAGKVDDPGRNKIFDPKSGQMKSWIVEILPELGEKAIAVNFDKTQSITRQALDPQATTIGVLCCPSDDASGLVYSSRSVKDKEFAKGNYAAFCSPFHTDLCARYPGALTAFRKRKTIPDGVRRTMLLGEILTRDHEQDQRGAWALPWTGSSLLAYDMHARKRDPFEPSSISEGFTQLPNNQGPVVDMLYECPEPAKAQLEKVPCEVYDNEPMYRFLSAAPRSNHIGGVNIAYMSGNVFFVNNSIDEYVMAYQISSNDGQSKLPQEIEE